jgi:hypothetical protein
MCSSGWSMWSQQKGEEHHIPRLLTWGCALGALVLQPAVRFLSDLQCCAVGSGHLSPAVCSQRLSPHCLRCRYPYLCRVQLGAGGMDALIRLGCGDMRRTLNILQVRHAQHSRCDALSVLVVVGTTLTA